MRCIRVSKKTNNLVLDQSKRLKRFKKKYAKRNQSNRNLEINNVIDIRIRRIKYDILKISKIKIISFFF